MSKPFNTIEVHSGDEASFAEASTSYDTNFRVISEPRFTPNHVRMQDPAFRSRLAQRGISHLGPRSGSLEFQTYMIGAASTGALTETWQQRLLGDGLGGNHVTQDGGTVNVVTNATTFSATSFTGGAGGVIRVGTKGDGGGDGQAAVINNPATVTLLTALPAAPTTGHQIHACQIAYHDESTVTTLQTKRFMIGHTTEGCQYHMRGCQLAGATFGEPIGGMPTINWRYEVAYYTEAGAGAAVAIPSAIALEDHDCVPVAGGSLFVQDFGTTTRNTELPSEIALYLALGLQPVISNSGIYADQFITGWVRTGIAPTISMLVPWSEYWSDWWDTVNGSLTPRHILWTRSVDSVGTRSGGWYAARVHPVGPRPTVDPWNMQTYQRINLECDESTTTSTELTRSSIRIFNG